MSTQIIKTSKLSLDTPAVSYGITVSDDDNGPAPTGTESDPPIQQTAVIRSVHYSTMERIHAPSEAGRRAAMPLTIVWHKFTSGATGLRQIELVPPFASMAAAANEMTILR